MLVAISLPALSFANDAVQAEQAAAVDALFAKYDRPDSPGVAVGVYRDGQPLLLRGYGSAHLEHGIPITPRTVFHVASVSKQFVAFSAALLAAEDRLDLDGDIREHLPRVPDFGPTISPRHLIYHTSGLRDQWTLFVLGGMEMDNRLRQGQILSMVERQRALNFAPGSDYAYSNTGYTLLAELVHAVSGDTLREFTDRRIFRPLDMRNTLFYDDVTEIVPNRAQSYEKGDDDEWRRSPLNFDNVGATSLHTTAGDLLAWAGNFLHPEVGKGEAIRQFMTTGELDDGRPLNYGFALQKRQFGGADALWHSGADAGYRSIFAVFPGDDFAVAILSNSPANLLVSLEQIAAIYLAGDSDENAWTRALPGKTDPEAAVVEALAGSYFHPGRPMLTLGRANDDLVYTVLDDEPESVVFRDDGSFDFGDESRLYGMHFRAVVGDDGEVIAIDEYGRSPVEGAHTVLDKISRSESDAAQLAALAGEYANDALDVTYTLAVQDGELTIRNLWTEPLTLRPTAPDHFEGEWPMHDLRLVRDGQGQVRAVEISSARARGVRLERISPQPTDARARMHTLIEELTEFVPGVSAAVATSDGVLWSGTAGWADIDAREPVTADRLFGIGSITKTFTSAILQQLADEGRIDLDRTIGSLLGDDADDIANAATATVRQLMNHTSGIPSWEDDPAWKREGRGADLDPEHDWGKLETLRYIRGVPALFEAGERYSYSNSNFTLLGRIVEVVTGRDLVDVIEDRIRRPAGIDSIFLEGFEPLPAERLATRYHFNTADFRRDAGINPAFVPMADGLMDVSATNLSVEWAAGGMVAAAGDLARYGVALFDGTLLTPTALADMTTFRPVRAATPDDAGPVAETGYGVFRRQIGRHQVLGHGGDVLGYSGWLYYEPQSGVALAILTNAGTMHTGPGVGAGSEVLRDGRFLDAAIGIAAAGAGAAQEQQQ